MDATLEVVKRDGRGKNEARRLRVAGRIPAVVYGAPKAGQASDGGVAVAADPKAVLRILHSEAGANSLITLKLDGGESQVMVKQYQLDPVTHQLLHADFYQLALDRVITVTVPVHLKGDPKGVKLQGGMLDFVTREVQVECLPANIPERIEIDVTDLALHDSIRIRDLPSDEKWTAVSEPETMLVHIILPKAEEAAAADTEETPSAEPEVAKKGKTDKEAEEPKK
jgi:large subunit ribosomal protein L25